MGHLSQVTVAGGGSMDLDLELIELADRVFVVLGRGGWWARKTLSKKSNYGSH